MSASPIGGSVSPATHTLLGKRRGPSSVRRPSADSLVSRERVEEILLKEIAFVPCQSFATDRRIESTVGLIRDVEQGTAIDEQPVGGGTGTQAHLATLGSAPLLTVEEEREGFRRMNLLRSRANALRSRLRVESPDARVIKRIEQALIRAERLEHHLIRANTRLVMSLARKYVTPRVSFDDLLSQGIRALMYAIEKFDYSRGYRFSTYATCAIRRDFYRFVMNQKRQTQRYCTGSQEALAEVSQPQRGSDLTDSEQISLNNSIASIVGRLDERERVIITSRFDLENEGKTLSYSKLGERLGISKERVRQLANRALEKLRGAAKEHKLDALLS